MSTQVEAVAEAACRRHLHGSRRIFLIRAQFLGQLGGVSVSARSADSA